MKKYLILKDNIIVDLLELEGYFNASEYEQDSEFYDTVQEYTFGTYTIGQEYLTPQQDLTLEVALENGAYKKHVKFTEGQVQHIAQGASLIDSSYNVVYLKSEKGLFESPRPTGVKVYSSDEQNPYSVGELVYVATLGSKKEYYLGLDSLEDVQTLLGELNYTGVVYPENVLTLLVQSPQTFKPKSTQKPFGIGVSGSGAETVVTGYVTLTLEQISEHLNVDITDWVQPEVPTLKITPRQMRLQLVEQELLDNIEPLIASLPETAAKIARIEWEFATEYDLYHPFMIQLGQALELNMLEFFNLASKK